MLIYQNSCLPLQVRAAKHSYNWNRDFVKYGPLPESINRLSDESDSDMECRDYARAKKCQVAMKKRHPSKFATASKSFLLRRRQWCKQYAKKHMKSAWDPELFRIFYPSYTFRELKEKTTPVITMINSCWYC